MRNAPGDILIIQMGKVASTAVAQALRHQGLSVLQAHIAAPQRLKGKLDTLMSAGVSDIVAARMYEDYLQELRVTFLLARQRASEVRAQKVPIISLTRDPLAWYWSHFAQNYDHYKVLLECYHAYHYGPDIEFSPEKTFYEVQNTMFAILENTEQPIDCAEALPQLMAEADFYDPTNVVFSQLNRFLMPLRWFNEDFLPATGVDVYSSDFDGNTGVGVINTDKFSILLMRYENLAELSPHIAQFVGLDSLNLQRANISEDKNVPIDLKSMQARAQREIPSRVLSRIYQTRYARHFGYTAKVDAATRVPEAKG